MNKIGISIFLALVGLCLGSGVASSGSSSNNADDGAEESDYVKRLTEGAPLMLVCNVTVMPVNTVVFQIEWKKNNSILVENDHIKIFPGNSSLYVAVSNEDDIGVYTCHTQPPAPSYNQTFHVVSLSFKHFRKSTTVLEGDKLSLICQVKGNPTPFIEWLKDGDSLMDDYNNTRLEFTENEFKVPNGSLLIKPVEESDRGSYVCLFRNTPQQYNTTTFVRVKDIYAALWPFLGIVVEVLLLCLVIFIYEKRRIKNDFEESDTDQGEQKNTVDQKSSDVRQRK